MPRLKVSDPRATGESIEHRLTTGTWQGERVAFYRRQYALASSCNGLVFSEFRMPRTSSQTFPYGPGVPHEPSDALSPSGW